jgi:hypothetical protein
MGDSFLWKTGTSTPFFIFFNPNSMYLHLLIFQPDKFMNGRTCMII